MRNARSTVRNWLAVIVTMMALTLGACSASTDTAPMSAPEQGSVPDAVEAGGAADAVEADGAAVPEAAPEELREEGGNLPGEGDAAMLIVTKTIRMEVPEADSAVDEIRQLAAARDGGITDMEVASDGGWVYPEGEGRVRGLRAWLTARVPAAEYEAFVADVAALGEVQSQSEASSDVTQQHVDLSARLKNLQAQEQRLREFFDAAESVTEMLSVETELGRVRGDIESLDAQIKHLERKAAMVTVNVHLSEPGSLVDSKDDSWGFGEALTDGLRGAVELLTGLLTFLIATSPLWIIGLILFVPVRAWLRRRRGARQQVSSPPEATEADHS